MTRESGNADHFGLQTDRNQHTIEYPNADKEMAMCYDSFTTGS